MSETSAGVLTAFRYDPYGNMSQKAGNGAVLSAMAYADGVHLTGLTVDDDPPATLTYDALGRLDRRVTDAVTETYAYAGLGETVRRIDDGTTLRTSLVDDAGSRLSLTTGG